VAASKPLPIRNVLFILSDDHAAYALGAYGNTLVRTPNLDRLARTGIRFDRAYANSPVCTPSRQSLITGKLPHAAGVTLLSTPLSSDQLTIAEHLKKSGFATGAVGKMHFVNERLRHGFDFRVDLPDYTAHLKSHPARPPPSNLSVKPPWRPFRDPARVWLNADMLPEGVYDADSSGTYLAQRAIKFLGEHQSDRFCLWLGFHEPHSPFDFPIEYQGRIDPNRITIPKKGPEDDRWFPEIFRNLTEQDQRGIAASYYTAVEYLDKNVGLVLDALDRLGLAESTLVVYAGDQGYLLGHHGRFEKHTMWEPAVRIPLLLRNPTRLGSAKQIPALVEMLDLAPTLLDLLGVPPMPGAQGKSLVPLLDGSVDHIHEEVFSEYLPDHMAMLRTDRWKFVFSSGQHDLALGYQTGRAPLGREQRLYDEQSDPEEHHNLASDPNHTPVAHDLRQRMLQVFLRTDPRAARVPKDLSVEQKLDWFLQPPEGGKD
jgi:choline-sulfatase